jgi:putative ABC transport system permease protein
MRPRVTRFYNALLQLYPSGFRSEYRADLLAAFAERARDFSGPFAWLRITFVALGDVVPNAIAAHWEILRQDVGFAVRSLRRTPGFALTAIFVVALGVGANTAAFSLADFVLIRPLPFSEPDRLVRLWQQTPGYGRLELSPANYRDWKASLTTIDRVAAYTGDAMNLIGTGEPRRLDITRATPDFFETLRVAALAGRTFGRADSTNADVMVLSYGLWQTQFGGDPGVIGRVVRLNGSPYTITGVMPPSFLFPNRQTQAWVPLLLTEQDFADRGDNYLETVARLRAGTSIERAGDDLTAVAKHLEEAYPKENEKTGGVVIPLRGEFSERAKLLVVALCGATGCILLLACANLASLLLARATHRARELAVRAALGAGRERLVRQLVTESVGLAALGGLLGLSFAVAGLPLLARLVPNTLPIAEQPTLDLRVLIVASAIVVITGLAFGVGPAIGAGRSNAIDALREGARSGGGRTQRTRTVLVIVEVAASVVLLVSSGLLIRAVLRIQATDPGFRAENVLTLRTALSAPRYQVDAARSPFYDRVLTEIRALPGIQNAGYVSGVPMRMRGGIWGVSLVGAPVTRDGASTTALRFATPEYFATMGIPLRAGRDIAGTDTRERPLVAVVSESFVERYWPNENPIGKQFAFQFGRPTVIGVVGDVRVRGLERTSEPQMYLAARQMPDSTLGGYVPKDLVIRSTVPVSTLLAAVRRIIAAADPDQPISDVAMMSDVVALETASRLTQLRLLGILSAIALLIAGVGIHGLLAFAVSRRARELGVRRALGEQASSILRRVLTEGMTLAGVGVAVGVFVAYLAARGMSALLAGVEPGDPLTIGAAAALCLGTAILGCVRPALRASRVDPISALRGD